MIPVQQISLGRTGLTVSALCFGAMNLGSSVDKAASFRLLDTFVDEGGTFLDTSNNYAHWVAGCTGDESETLLGEWLHATGKRNAVQIATKVGFDRHGAGAGLTARQIEYWCDESLRKLRTDVIDLYYAHVDDPHTPPEETMDAFTRLRKKGKIRALGASNHYAWRLAEIRRACDQNGLDPYTVLQQKFTYLFAQGGISRPYPYNVNAGIEHLRYLAQADMPLVAYSCLASGGYADNARLPANYIQGERLATLNRMAAEKGVPPSTLVLAWMLRSVRFADRPRIVPLFSSSCVEHLRENLRAVDLVLDTAEVAALNEA